VKLSPGSTPRKGGSKRSSSSNTSGNYFSTGKERQMSVAKVTEISASSKESFDDAIKKGIKRADKTLDRIQGAWVNEMKLKVDDGEITEYRVNMKVTFVLKD
jgi:flavin-binding protein dodecin